ncbi:hypothetical protein QR98_0051730 [Sarcoptes scabiei]|uniref:Uncharacterized protein n=1 Tax=Sarcoptes scabiei TaxID=52283 RepID=A0A132A7T1_SARSC|nr:hypothetical protein QR98_0051730 [Sarcoptes scabiei]
MKKSIRALWSIAIDHFTVSLKANLVSIGTNENDHLILLPPEQEYNPSELNLKVKSGHSSTFRNDFSSTGEHFLNTRSNEHADNELGVINYPPLCAHFGGTLIYL